MSENWWRLYLCIVAKNETEFLRAYDYQNGHFRVCKHGKQNMWYLVNKKESKK